MAKKRVFKCWSFGEPLEWAHSDEVLQINDGFRNPEKHRNDIEQKHYRISVEEIKKARG